MFNIKQKSEKSKMTVDFIKRSIQVYLKDERKAYCGLYHVLNKIYMVAI